MQPNLPRVPILSCSTRLKVSCGHFVMLPSCHVPIFSCSNQLVHILSCSNLQCGSRVLILQCLTRLALDNGFWTRSSSLVLLRLFGSARAIHRASAGIAQGCGAMRATVRNQVYDTYKARMHDGTWLSDRRAMLAHFYKLEEEMVRSSAMAPGALLRARRSACFPGA